MKTYMALFEYKKGRTGFRVVFPDLPGLTGSGGDYAEALRTAHEGLAAHIGLLGATVGGKIPKPRTLEQLQKTWKEWKEWEADRKFLVVPITLLPLGKRAKRINISMSEALIARIDMVAQNRSEFISRAVENALGGGEP